MTPLANIKYLFGEWLNGCDKKTKTRIRVGVCVLFFVQFGIIQMTLFLTKLAMIDFYRLFTKLHIEFTCGLIFYTEDQQVHIESGCTCLMMLVRDIFNQDG
jgi:hypothetical protein